MIPPSPRISSTSDGDINPSSVPIQEKPLIPIEEKVNPNDYSITHISKAWKSWRVWRLFLMILFSSFGVTMIMTTYRTIAIAKDINTRIVQIIGTSGFIIMCVCTPLWGVLADKINFRFLLLILNIASAALSYLYYLSIFNDISFLIATLSLSVIMAGNSSIFVPHIMKVFGMKYYIEIGGLIIMGIGISTSLSATFAFIINVYLNDSDLSFLIMFICGGGLATIAVFLGLFENDTPFEY